MKTTYYFKGIKLRTTEHDYKYALIRANGEFTKCLMMSEHLENIIKRRQYLTAGYIAREKGLNTDKYWSDQFKNPNELMVIDLEKNVHVKRVTK